MYAILNMGDTTHYIRVQKAFLDEGKNAITMAANADSSFYPETEIEVKILEYAINGTIPGALLSTSILSRVDMNTEGYIKDPPKNGQGFFSSPNYGYKFRKQLSVASMYQLLVVNKVSGRTDSSGLFGVVNAETSKGGGNFYISSFDKAGLQVAFPTTRMNASVSFSGTMPLNGKIVEGHIVFHYVEKDRSTGTEERKQADMIMNTSMAEPGTQFSVVADNASIYSYLYDEIGPAPNGIERYMDSCDIYMPVVMSYTPTARSVRGSLGA